VLQNRSLLPSIATGGEKCNQIWVTSVVSSTLVGEQIHFSEEVVEGILITEQSSSKAHIVIGSIRPIAIALALDGGKSLKPIS
jgi:hypothetical protein